MTQREQDELRARRPCEPSGRPLDPVAASWWDGGFKVEGYVRPPATNFKKYLREVRRSEDPRRMRRLARRAQNTRRIPQEQT